MLLSPVENPYWDAIKVLLGEEDWSGHWEPSQFLFSPEGQVKETRRALVVEYAWAIPDPATLRFIAEHAGSRIVEMGAGTGYWSWMLAQLGGDILAFDAHPPHCAKNEWHQTGKTYYDVQPGTPEDLARYSDRTLFLCWPPYDTDMAARCLQHYPGDRLIYIGEGSGGCTGDEEFHGKLEAEWEEIASHRPIQWEGIHDWVTVYEKKKS